MAKFELKLPKMGESVAEATITSWLKEIGDTIEVDEAVLEIATDKVDSEIPSEVDGVLVEKLFKVDDVVQVGQTIAFIEIKGDNDTVDTSTKEGIVSSTSKASIKSVAEVAQTVIAVKTTATPVIHSNEERFYSPLVKNIAKKESPTQAQAELDTISGTGKEGRVTKNDILAYIETRGSQPLKGATIIPETKPEPILSNGIEIPKPAPVVDNPVAVSSGEDEIIEMTRMGKLVAKHMVDSVQTSAHVQSFIEADVTNIWNWRNKVKDDFKKREGENLTFTPIFMEAVAKALRDYPMMNISVQGETIIKKKNINLGMAAALGDGNLIVPVIKKRRSIEFNRHD